MITSGAMYAGVPTICLALVPIRSIKPKSMQLLRRNYYVGNQLLTYFEPFPRDRLSPKQQDLPQTSAQDSRWVRRNNHESRSDKKVVYVGDFAAGVGTTDLEVGILKGVCAFKTPQTMRIDITGSLAQGVYAKDVILAVIGKIGVNGATNRVIEFTGPVVDAMSMEARMTLCNMAVEAGGTCGICRPDQTTVDYLWPFISDIYADKKAALKDFQGFTADEDAVYVEVIDFNIGDLEPVATFGFKPDQVKPVSQMEDTPVDQVYIGSCTNGRLEDLQVAADVLAGKRIDDRVRGSPPLRPGDHRVAGGRPIGIVEPDAQECLARRRVEQYRLVPGRLERQALEAGNAG